MTLELEDRIGDEENPTPLLPDEAHVRLLGVAPGALRRGLPTPYEILRRRRTRERQDAADFEHISKELDGAGFL